MTASRARAVSVLNLLDRTLADARARGHEYLLGPAPTALDVHAAVTLGIVAPLPDAECPTPPPVRHALETLDPSVREAVSPELLRHRALTFERHLVRPVRF